MSFRKVRKSLKEDFVDLRKHDVNSLAEARNSDPILEKIANAPWKVDAIKFDIDIEYWVILYNDERGFNKNVKGLRTKRGYKYSSYRELFFDVQEKLNVGITYQRIEDGFYISAMSDRREPGSVKDLYNIFGSRRNLLRAFMDMGLDEGDLEDYLEDVENRDHSESAFYFGFMCWSPDITFNDWEYFSRNYRASDLL